MADVSISVSAATETDEESYVDVGNLLTESEAVSETLVVISG